MLPVVSAPPKLVVVVAGTIGSVTPDLQATLKKLPDRPGVYLMRDARGDVVYVGKAQSLRSRVRSYWQKGAGLGPLEEVFRNVNTPGDYQRARDETGR